MYSALSVYCHSQRLMPEKHLVYVLKKCYVSGKLVINQHNGDDVDLNYVMSCSGLISQGVAMEGKPEHEQRGVKSNIVYALIYPAISSYNCSALDGCSNMDN